MNAELYATIAFCFIAHHSSFNVSRLEAFINSLLVFFDLCSWFLHIYRNIHE